MKNNRAYELIEDGLVTVRDAAAFLSISVAGVYSLMSRGALPYVKIGRCRRIPKRGLVEIAAQHLMASKCTGLPHAKGGEPPTERP